MSELLRCLKKSSKRTAEAIIKKEKIGIFGDYDVDGATSTALLGKYFSELNIPYKVYIPDRKKEGYGPTIKSFKELISNGVSIIFTVDCGTLSFDAINYARERNIPFFGICLGMQLAVIEIARNVLKLKNANSSEFGPCKTKPLLFSIHQLSRIGLSMRLHPTA